MKKNKYNNNMSKKNRFSSKSKLAKILGLSAGAIAITTVAAGTVTSFTSASAYKAQYGIVCDSTYQKIIYGATATYTLNLRDSMGGTPGATDVNWSVLGATLADNSNAFFVQNNGTSATLTTVDGLNKGSYSTTVSCEFKIAGVSYRTERTFTTVVVENVLPEIAIGGQTSSTYAGLSGFYGISYKNVATASLASGSISGVRWSIQSDASALDLTIDSSTGVISFAGDGFTWDPSMKGTYNVKIIASKDNYLDSTFNTTLTISLNSGSRIYSGYMSSESPHGTSYTYPYGDTQSAGLNSSYATSNFINTYEANVPGGTWTTSGFSGAQIWLDTTSDEHTSICEFYWGRKDSSTNAIVSSTNAGNYTGSLIYSVPGYEDAVTDITLSVTGQALPNPQGDNDITIQYGTGNASLSVGNLCTITGVDVAGYNLGFKLVDVGDGIPAWASIENLEPTSVSGTSLSSYTANLNIINDGVVSACAPIGEYDLGVIFTAENESSQVAPNVIPSEVMTVHLKVVGKDSYPLVGNSLINVITSYHYNSPIGTIATPSSCSGMSTDSTAQWFINNVTSSEIASLGSSYSSYTPVPAAVWDGNGTTQPNFSLVQNAYVPSSSSISYSIKLNPQYAIPESYGDSSVASWVIRIDWKSNIYNPQSTYIVVDPRNYKPNEINGIGNSDTGDMIQAILGKYDSTSITLLGKSDEDDELENITNSPYYDWDILDSEGSSVKNSVFGLDDDDTNECKVLWWTESISSTSGELRDQYGKHYKIKVTHSETLSSFSQDILMNLGNGQITKLAGTTGASRPFTDNWNASYSWTLQSTNGIPENFSSLANHWAITGVDYNNVPMDASSWQNNFFSSAGTVTSGLFNAPFSISSTTAHKLSVGRYVIHFKSELTHVIPLPSEETFTLIIAENVHPTATIYDATGSSTGTSLTNSWDISTNTSSEIVQQYGIQLSGSTETSIYGGTWTLEDLAINGTSWNTPYTIAGTPYTSSNYIQFVQTDSSPSSFGNLTIDIRGISSASAEPNLPAGTSVTATIKYKQNNWSSLSIPLNFNVRASDYVWGTAASSQYLYNSIYQGSSDGEFVGLGTQPAGSFTSLLKHALPDGTSDTTNVFKFPIKGVDSSNYFSSAHFQLLTQTNQIVTGSESESGFWLTTEYKGWDEELSSSSVAVTVHWSQENVVPGTYTYKIHWADTVATSGVNQEGDFFAVDVPVSINILGRTAFNTLVHSDSPTDTSAAINMLNYELGFNDATTVDGTDNAVKDFVNQLVNENSNRIAANQNSLTDDVIAHLLSSTTTYTTTISSTGIGTTVVKLGMDDSLYYNGLNRGAWPSTVSPDTSSYAFSFNWDATDYNCWDITNTSSPSSTGTVNWQGLTTLSNTSASIIRKEYTSSNCPTGLTPGVEYAYLTNVANSSLSSTDSSSIADDFVVSSSNGQVKFPRYINTSAGRRMLVGWTAGQTLDKQTPYRGFIGSGASAAKITLKDDFIDMTGSFICTAPSSLSPRGENYLPIEWTHINVSQVLMQSVRNAGTFFGKYASSVDLARCGLTSTTNGDGFKFWYIQENAGGSITAENKILCAMARTSNTIYNTGTLTPSDTLPKLVNVAQMAVDGSIASFNDGTDTLYFNKFQTLSLPNTLQLIQEKSFANNTSLTTLTFTNMSKLLAINYDGLEGTGSFANCMNLTSIYFPSTAWLGYYGFGPYTFPTGYTNVSGAARKCNLYVGEGWITANADGSRPTWRTSQYTFGGGLNNNTESDYDSSIPLYTFSSAAGGYIYVTLAS